MFDIGIAASLHSLWDGFWGVRCAVAGYHFQQIYQVSNFHSIIALLQWMFVGDNELNLLPCNFFVTWVICAEPRFRLFHSDGRGRVRCRQGERLVQELGHFYLCF